MLTYLNLPTPTPQPASPPRPRPRPSSLYKGHIRAQGLARVAARQRQRQPFLLRPKASHVRRQVPVSQEDQASGTYVLPYRRGGGAREDAVQCVGVRRVMPAHFSFLISKLLLYPASHPPLSPPTLLHPPIEQVKAKAEPVKP